MTEEDILELNNPENNRREFERNVLTVEIRFDGGDARGVATTRDIGLGGLYMATDTDLREGTLLSMRMQVGGRELVVSGVVVYCDQGNGCGVRFHNLSEEAESILRKEFPQN